MSEATDNLQAALERGMALRPRVGGFPYLAEVLRQAGILRNDWHLPACQAIYITSLGAVATQLVPLASGMVEVPQFNEAELIHALRTNQAGESDFPQFLQAAWAAGVVGYSVDFTARNVTYRGAGGEQYVEAYPPVEL